ncbi:MAG: hypothetical protein K0U13_04265, partial [Chlamydiae bacterium]|nr:hypothetical protein [Chlamydiota bacterium]
MVENIQPTQGPQMPQEPKKPIYSDVYTVQKTESDLDTLKLTLKTAKKIEKEEARSSVAQEDVEKSHEEEGVALHKKEKKKKKEVKSARQKKMEHLSSIRAVKEVDTKTDKQEGEESPLQDYDPNQLPPGLQKAYEQQMGSMQKFFQMLLQSGDPKIIALVQSWQKELANMHTPPTAADATQLNMMMQLMQNLISKLPPNVQSEFYQIEVQMYNQMKNDANSDIKNLTPQLAKLRDLINMEQKLVPILQQGAQAAEALAGGDPNYNDFLAMGSNILALEEMLESLPPNSPMRSEIQKALQAWGSITSSNPNFPPGMILGYSIFLAAMQQFASKGGTKKDLQQVWDRFSNFDTMGIPGLKQAIDFIQNKFPSPSMTPTDWSFSSDGHIIMNYEAFNQLISGGMAKALNNIGSVAKALEDEAAAASSQLSNDQTEQQQTQNLYNEASHDLGIFLQLLQKAEGHVKPAGPPGGNYVQKALDPLIRKEIEGYRMLIKILEQYLPGQDFSNIERLLDSVASHLPNVSEGDLKSLNGILGQLNKAAQGIPCKSFKASYWGAELDLFNTLSEIGSATTDNSGIIYQTIQDIENIMKRMEGGSFTAADMSQLVTDIETLMKNGQVLSYGDSNAISNFLESLSNVMGAGFGSATGSEANLYNVI